MQLNLPIFDQLASCRNLLIAGMGGGFDVFSGLPIYFEPQRRGQQTHLASNSFTPIAHLKAGVRLTETLVGVTIEATDSFMEAAFTFFTWQQRPRIRPASRIPLP